MNTQLTRAQNKLIDFQKILETSLPVKTDINQFTDHFFAPGIYLRTFFLPKGHVVVGKIHSTECLNILLKGKISIATSSGERMVAEAPFIFMAKKGQKALFAIEDAWYANIHPNEDNTTDLKKLEHKFIAQTYKELEK